MIERVRSFDAHEAALAAFAVAGASAFAWGRNEPGAWLILLAVAPAAAFRLGSIPARVRGVVEKAVWVAVGLLAAVVLNWLASPAGQGQASPPLPAAACYAAPLVSALLLTGRSVFSPSRALVPAVLITTVLGASQDRSARAMAVVLGLVVLAGLLVLLSAPGYGPASPLLARLLRLAGFAVMALTIALGISRLLPWAQPHVVQAAARAAFPEAISGFSPETRLGDAGELQLSTEVVLRVWSDRPRKLRASAAMRFDGRAWHGAPGTLRRVPVSTWVPPGDLAAWLDELPGRTFLVASPESAGLVNSPAGRTRILLVLSVPGAIPAPAGVVAIRVPVQDIVADAAGLLSPSLPPETYYSLVNGTPEKGDSPGPEALALPADTDPRLVALAAKLAVGATSDDERLARTLDYLQTELRYSLRPGRFRSRQPVAEFVFDKQRGWCEYFASAAAVLLRLQGVPTRYVKGFQLRARLFRGGHYVVRQADAHAWIEAWLPGRGWVEADPTPAAGYDAAHGGPGAGWLGEAWQWLRGLGGRLGAVDWKAVPRVLWTELVAVAQRAQAKTLLLVAFALAAVAAALRVAQRFRRARRRAKPTRQRPGDELAHLLAGLDRAWARRGVARPPSRPPLEHLLQLDPDRVPPALLDVGRRVVDAYYRVRFAGGPVDPGEAETLQAALRRLP